MKKKLSLPLLLALLMMSMQSFAQCPTGLQVNINNRFPAFDATGQPVCIVQFDVSFSNTFALGTTEIAAFFYPSGTAQPLPGNTWPACSDLGNYLAGFSLNAISSNPADLLFDTFTATDGVCPNPGPPIRFQDEGEGLVAVIDAQTGRMTVSGVTATVPGGCTDPTLSLDVLFFSKTATSANNTVCNFTTTLALPVTYAEGSIKAILSGGKLTIDWQTLSETNNAKFVVLGSADGVKWSEIGTVKSQAVNGNSDRALNYQLVVGLPVSIAALSFALLLFFPAFKSRVVRVALLAVMVGAIAVACNKGGKGEVDVNKDGVNYVRLAQYDKDGNTPKLSKIVKVVKE